MKRGREYSCSNGRGADDSDPEDTAADTPGAASSWETPPSHQPGNQYPTTTTTQPTSTPTPTPSPTPTPTPVQVQGRDALRRLRLRRKTTLTRAIIMMVRVDEGHDVPGYHIAEVRLLDSGRCKFFMYLPKYLREMCVRHTIWQVDVEWMPDPSEDSDWEWDNLNPLDPVATIVNIQMGLGTRAEWWPMMNAADLSTDDDAGNDGHEADDENDDDGTTLSWQGGDNYENYYGVDSDPADVTTIAPDSDFEDVDIDNDNDDDSDHDSWYEFSSD
jgi:hypothetical protein